MPDCGVHYLWFAFVCFLIRSPPPPLTPVTVVRWWVGVGNQGQQVCCQAWEMHMFARMATMPEGRQMTQSAA